MDRRGLVRLNRIAPAHALEIARPHGYVVTLASQARDHARRYPIFDPHAATIKIAFGEASCLQGGFNIHPEIDDIGNKLCVRLCLVEAAHDAESDPPVTALHKRGNDGVQRTRSRAKRIWPVRLQGESTTAILQREAGARGNQPTTERSRIALDQRDLIAVTINNGKIGGVAR